ncbi:hypothetical protein ACFRCG_39850 [Embleya sp. NPDC056575]|uniref:hypothetical protein n=1 Tax=unclassified Embleya TaxID=2699296 RepID=UPI0036AD60FF
MARGTITPTQGSRAGTTMIAATTGDATNGHQVAYDSRTAILAKNTGVTSRTITFLPTRLVDGQSTAGRIETLAAGETQLFSGFDSADYGDTLRIDVAHAEVTIQAVRL